MTDGGPLAEAGGRAAAGGWATAGVDAAGVVAPGVHFMKQFWPELTNKLLKWSALSCILDLSRLF
jgi:hypothetical protein